MKFCPECGSKLASESAKFCSECGFKLNNISFDSDKSENDTENNNVVSQLDLILEEKLKAFEYTQYVNGEIVILKAIETHTKTIVVPEGVSIIGADAFSGHKRVEEVYLPEGLIAIEDRSFKECIQLKKINIPSSVTLISDEAFYGCSNLKEVYLPDGLSTLGIRAFSECRLLERINDIPKSITKIPDDLFLNCVSLKEIVLHDDVSKIGQRAFSNTAIETIVIPSSVTDVSNEAFYACIKLKRATLQHGVESIGNKAFGSCTKLEQIDLPETIKIICSEAFSDCRSLTSFTVPSGTWLIEKYCFSHCEKLSQITIPKSVKYIGSMPCFCCFNLKKVIIEGNRKIMHWYELDESAEEADLSREWNPEFELPFDCKIIRKSNLSKDPPSKPSEKNKKALNTTTKASKPAPIKEKKPNLGQFENMKCEALSDGSFKLLAYLDQTAENVVLPESITEIRSGVFENCTELYDIELPSTLNYIGVDAFAKCSSLQTITIPRSVDNIDSGAFEGCCNLENVIFEDPNGWYYEDDEAGDPDDCEIDIPPDDLKDPQKAAELLKTRDKYTTWLKRD